MAGIRKVQARAGQIKEITNEEAQELFKDKAIPEIKVDGIDDRLAMLESKIAFLLGAIGKPLVSSDNYRFVTSDNKILKVL